MDCRPACAACCIIPSISSLNKPAFEPCRWLDDQLRCRLFGLPERPAVCSSLQPEPQMCGRSREEALQVLRYMEESTRPDQDQAVRCTVIESI